MQTILQHSCDYHVVQPLIVHVSPGAEAYSIDTTAAPIGLAVDTKG